MTRDTNVYNRVLTNNFHDPVEKGFTETLLRDALQHKEAALNGLTTIVARLSWVLTVEVPVTKPSAVPAGEAFAVRLLAHSVAAEGRVILQGIRGVRLPEGVLPSTKSASFQLHGNAGERFAQRPAQALCKGRVKRSRARLERL